jgi:hypothetical protein
MMSVQLVFGVLMAVMACIGVFCASRLSSDNPLWVRLIVLYPALAALCTIAAMMRGHYVAYVQDIVMAVGLALLYALVASRFTSHPWLDIRTGDKP